MKYPLPALIASLLFAALPAQAQTLLGVKVEPAQAKVGEPVTVSAQFDLSKAQNCNVRIHFGDGQTTDAKINQEKDANLVVPYTYKAAGHYTVMVEPKTALPTLKCSGPNQKAVVTVVAPPPPPMSSSP
ncbi:PKD domain-containing protein, partial [Ideonella sp. A 288]|uniref:PKD domain-containing protein n=1 Tax=Ideonella sp. A 288 TaxID=1962181 RepID=UPI003855764A